VVTSSSDLTFFRDIHRLMPDFQSGTDVVFDFVTFDSSGRRLLSTLVKGHAGVICKRRPWPWLGEMIRGERDYLAANLSVVVEIDGRSSSSSSGIGSSESSSSAAAAAAVVITKRGGDVAMIDDDDD
jgi:hypothetical protein